MVFLQVFANESITVRYVVYGDLLLIQANSLNETKNMNGFHSIFDR